MSKKRDAAAEFDLLAGVGSQGTAALGVMNNLLRALRAKGVFSDIELLAILDGSAEQAQGGSDAASQKYARSVRRHIRDLQASVLSAPSGPTPSKH